MISLACTNMTNEQLDEVVFFPHDTILMPHRLSCCVVLVLLAR
jgi:hypothetical protein